MHITVALVYRVRYSCCQRRIHGVKWARHIVNHITGIDQSTPHMALGVNTLYINPSKNRGAGARLRVVYMIRMRYLQPDGVYRAKNWSRKKFGWSTYVSWVVNLDPIAAS